MISVIETIQKTDNKVYVRAIVEDMIQIYSVSQYDSPEYGPALCETTFQLEEDEILPDGDDALIEYIESLDPYWEVVDTSDYDLD